MTIFSVADVLTGVIEALLMLMLCTTFCAKRENLPLWIYFASVILVSTVINISNMIFNFGMLNVVVMILAFFALSFLFKGKITTRAIISVLQYLILIITEVIILFVITMIFSVTTAEVINTPSYRLLGIMVSKMFALLVINIIRSKYKRNRYISTPYWTLFFLMLLSSVATMFLICKLTYDLDGGYIYELSMLCSFGLLFSTFSALYLYEHLTKQAETIRNQEQYEQHLGTQLKHLDDILITQKQIKKFKHDYNNFQIGLQAYLDNNDIIGASNYLKKLKEKTIASSSIIETGNIALDAILSTKIAIAESKGIVVNTKIQIPEDISVDPIDMCRIIGNALDNAIEACDRTEISNKKISITIICKDTTVLCKVVNTAPMPKSSLLDTSKSDKQNHGFGLENIKTALSKYNANPTIERTDSEFTLKFVIFTKE